MTYTIIAAALYCGIGFLVSVAAAYYWSTQLFADQTVSILMGILVGMWWPIMLLLGVVFVLVSGSLSAIERSEWTK